MNKSHKLLKGKRQFREREVEHVAREAWSVEKRAANIKDKIDAGDRLQKDRNLSRPLIDSRNHGS